MVTFCAYSHRVISCITRNYKTKTLKLSNLISRNLMKVNYIFSTNAFNVNSTAVLIFYAY